MNDEINRAYLENKIILNDKAIQKYFNSIRAKTKNNGYLSINTEKCCLKAVRAFLHFLKIPITTTSITDLIEYKINYPKDFTTDDKLEIFSNLEPIKTHRVNATYIKGIFKHNRAPLQTYIDNHFSRQTEPINEKILMKFIKQLSLHKQLMIYLQAYSGQRIQALSMTPIINYTIKEKYTLIKILSHLNKTRLEHYTIIPTYLAKKIIKYTESKNRKQPFPNYKNIWQQITKEAKQKYNIPLTSHYLRKRFFSIAEKTIMPINHWDYLMGSKKQTGHCAESYSLNNTNKIIEEYNKHLYKPLSLDKNHQDTPLSSLKTEEPENLNIQILKEILEQLKYLNKNIIST